jgi:hypothetical protein
MRFMNSFFMNTKNNIGSQLVVDAPAKGVSEIISEAECLRRVPVSRRTWFAWRADGKVPTIKIGRRCLFHWPSVEAALLRMQRGGVMLFVFLFAALATSVMGNTPILGFSPEAPATNSVAGNLSAGNTTTGQTADRNANVAVHGNVSTTARGLCGVVAATAMTKLDWPSGGIIASSPFPPAWDQTRFVVPSSQNHQVVCAAFVPGQADWQIEMGISNMTPQVVVGPSKTNIVKSTQFVLRTPLALPTKGLHNAVIGEVTKEEGMENYAEINRVRVPVILEQKASDGKPHNLDKVYNVGADGRRLKPLLQDFYAWSGVNVAKEDIYTFDLCAAMNGKAVVVDVGYHINGTKVTAYIKAFYPAGTVEAVAAAQA